MLIGPRDGDRILRALEAGISAYVPTNAPIEVLLSAFRHAAVAPSSFTAPDLAAALARHRRQQHLLSPREGEVLRLLHQGSSVPRIAEVMLVSESTIKTYLARLYDKLGVNDSMLRIHILYNRKRLYGAAQYLPLLDRVAKDETLVHIARERAAEVAELMRGQTVRK